MESHQSRQSNQAHAYPRPSHPHLQNILPPSRSANSTPASSPGLFTPSHPRPNMSFPPQSASDAAAHSYPTLHALQQSHKPPVETHKANVEHDCLTGRKIINNYEIIEELGRGVHGKVKLARNQTTQELVAIKIIPRFSKKRRLGKVTSQDKSKREIAILKKIRHPNVVALLEIIDDPEQKKIYMVLEFAEAGEITWRKKGLPHICNRERERQEREMRGEKITPEQMAEQKDYNSLMEEQHARKSHRSRISGAASAAAHNYWSLEHGAADDEDEEYLGSSYGRGDAETFGRSARCHPDSKSTSRAPSRNQSGKDISRTGTPHQPLDTELASRSYETDMVNTPGFFSSQPNSATALEGTMYGPYSTETRLRGRAPSAAGSFHSHISFDYNRIHDAYADDFSYVPCFTIEHARHTFRDTVLGLEYLHYQGVVHRDIKPPNLLQTKDYRVKISDFGVSYFGRPIRDGDETISESEAQDFDNDLELAKTVGTPAFFAPELCYTDTYDDGQPGVQPKVTEQIDVWSLGVTLFCIIYARIPFIGEDEWHMFRKIASEEVYIPRKRLLPVDPATKPNEKSLFTRVNQPPYRDDDVLIYEDVDEDLIDLLSKMLVKNPEKRIRLRDVKRHPFVTKGITNVISWLDDTDPSRRTSGRKIQVDDKEVAHAVVPLTLLEKVSRSFKKILRRGHRGERSESVSVSSRRRATSSAASSGGESPLRDGSSTPNPRDARRKSLRPDDYFTGAQPGEHPLSQSVVASPTTSPHLEPQWPVSQKHASATVPTSRQLLELVSGLNQKWDEPQDRQDAQRTFPRHGHHRSVNIGSFLSLTAAPTIAHTVPTTPLVDRSLNLNDPSILRKDRDMRPPPDDSNRAQSMDRGLFASTDKRAEAKVALSNAVAPGSVHLQTSYAPSSVESVRRYESPSTYSPAHDAFSGHIHSEPNIYEKQRPSMDADERPLTAHRVEVKNTPPSHRPSPLKAFEPVDIIFSRQRSKTVNVQGRAPALEPEPAFVPCPPSPSNETFDEHPTPPSREETIATTMSSSSTSMRALVGTPLTSPSESASPLYVSTGRSAKDTAEQILTFQSDPSLPALLSSTSSVSADPEGEFLLTPGVPGRSTAIDTADSLTPPALRKEPDSGFPLDAQEQVLAGAVPVKLDESVKRTPVVMPAQAPVAQEQCDDGEDSDSDEGLVMARRKKPIMASEAHSTSRYIKARRRDTNASVGSTETAKKVFVDKE
ncbi:Serine/threonine-protein kinase ssp1 [Podospora conica]|nr:Serine/threonine-protein kinase ssp1 [Schizothecium conicum]